MNEEMMKPPPQVLPKVPPPMPQPGWWAKHWKWMVPLVCTGAFSCIILAVFGVVSLAFSSMKSSDPYREAVSRASNDARVEEALGTPLKTGFSVSGRISTSGTSGQAMLQIPISGPKGKGSIHVEGKKADGVWEYPRMTVMVRGTAQPIQLSR